MILYSNIDNLLIAMIATAVIIIVLFFLPAIIELKKPKDAGPRLIKDTLPKMIKTSLNATIADIEEEQNFTYRSTVKIAYPTSILPILEGYFSLF